MQELVIATNRESILSFASGVEVPAVLQHAGQDVLTSFMTFFTDQIRNKNTRDAYLKNAVAFFEWCGNENLAFADIESFHISAYVELLQMTKSDSTAKQHLSTIKRLCDWVVIQQMMSRNPAAAVRGPKLVQRKGKTAVLDEEGAKQFFHAFTERAVAQERPMHVVGRRRLPKPTSDGCPSKRQRARKVRKRTAAWLLVPVLATWILCGMQLAGFIGRGSS